MTDEDKHILKLFVDNKEMYRVVSEYMSDLPFPQDTGGSNEDYGSLIRAYTQLKQQMEDRLTEMRIMVGNMK